MENHMDRTLWIFSSSYNQGLFQEVWTSAFLGPFRKMGQGYGSTKLWQEWPSAPGLLYKAWPE